MPKLRVMTLASVAFALGSVALSGIAAARTVDGDLHGCSKGKYKCAYLWTCDIFNSAGGCEHSSVEIKYGPDDPWVREN